MKYLLGLLLSLSLIACGGGGSSNPQSSLGFSQEELAFRADLHRTYIGMIERAEKNITLLNVEKIANALEININDLFK